MTCSNKPVSLFLALSLLLIIHVNTQANDVILRFSANYSCSFVPLDSILIENLTQESSTTLFYPDTVLAIFATDIQDLPGLNNSLTVSQNYPNPFSGQTQFDVFLPEQENLHIQVFDLAGRLLNHYSAKLNRGLHHFTFMADSKNSFILTVNSETQAQQLLMLHIGIGGAATQIIYTGTSSHANTESNLLSGFNYNMGDELQFTGYVTDAQENVDYEVIVDTPFEDTDYFFDIANSVPDQPSDIDGSTIVLANADGLVYEVSNIEGVDYSWTVPEGWVIDSGQGTHLINATAGEQSGTISVGAANACGTSPLSTLDVEVAQSGFFLSLIVDPAGSGNVTGGGAYAEGQQVNISATANQGWEFVNWTGDTEYIDEPFLANTIVTIPGKDISLTANFEEDEDAVFVCGSEIVFIYGDQQVTYGTIERNGLCWMDRNLGAEPMPFVPADDALGNADSRLFGDLYQWGRLHDGHQNRQSPITYTLSGADIPGHGHFIVINNPPYDWRSPQNPNLWQGEEGINNPCPPGWRVPTEAEMLAELLTWTPQNPSGAYASTLKWPVGGYRSTSGELLNEGSWGIVWSSTTSGTGSRILFYFGQVATILDLNRAFGVNARCVLDTE